MLEIQNLRKRYWGITGGKDALMGIDLTVNRGEIVGLFGENGAGKTTLLKSILGLHSYSGKILLDGAVIDEKNRDRISFATGEHSFFPNLTPDAHKDFYQMHFLRFNEKRYEGLMKFFDLPAYRSLKTFSAGQKNQFEVILALCQGADYILLDEPFVGNDIFNREDFYKVLLGILEEHETVILSTHLVEEVENFVSRAVLIKEGGLIGDVTTEELEERGENLVSYIKSAYQYRPDRVSKALKDLG
jgi:ABC-2 type transport system ATP-binding protein